MRVAIDDTTILLLYYDTLLTQPIQWYVHTNKEGKKNNPFVPKDDGFFGQNFEKFTRAVNTLFNVCVETTIYVRFSAM